MPAPSQYTKAKLEIVSAPAAPFARPTPPSTLAAMSHAGSVVVAKTM